MTSSSRHETPDETPALPPAVPPEVRGGLSLSINNAIAYGLVVLLTGSFGGGALAVRGNTEELRAMRCDLTTLREDVARMTTKLAVLESQGAAGAGHESRLRDLEQAMAKLEAKVEALKRP